MAAQGIVFGADQRRPWLAARSVRSLRSAGLENLKIIPSGESPDLPDGPVVLLRAGAWLRERGPLKSPPESNRGLSVLALGIPHSGKESKAWHVAHETCGGDYTNIEKLPEIVCARCESGKNAVALLRSLSTAQKHPSYDRIIHWPAFDVEDDASMRVIQVVTSLQHGGAERIAWDMHEVLPQQGFASCIVTLGSPLRRMLPAPPCWIDLAGMSRDERAQTMKDIVAWFGADVIHGHLIDADDAARFSESGTPLVMTIHNTNQAWPAGIEALHASECALIIACAQAVERELRQASIPIPIRTAWNGIAAGNAGPRPRLNQDTLTLACIANPRPQKRLHLLPPILAAVRKVQPNARLIIAGEASPRSESALECFAQTQRAAEEYGVAESIEWTNGEEHTAAVLARSDVLVSPSLHEGLSLAQLEALAAGLPVVATDVGGNAEVAWRNASMKLLPVNATADEFANAIKEAVKMPSNENTGIDVVQRDFTRERLSERCAFLYEACFIPIHDDADATLWFITNNLSTGGAQSSLRRLAKELHQSGTCVRIALLQEYPEHPTPGREDMTGMGIPVAVLPPAGTLDALDAVKMLLAEMRSAPPHAVVFWNVIPIYKFLIADAMLRVPVYDVSPGEMFFASLERYFQKPRHALPYRSARDYGARLAGVIVKYQGEATLAAEQLGAPTHVIPNGVVLREVPPRHQQEGNIVIGTAARLNPQKRLEDLIEAFKQALPRLPPCVLRIAGGVEDGCADYAALLKEQASGLPVEWLGDVQDMAAFHAALDVFAMISEPAGCPNASLEAMAAALPVIATEVGGVSEQVIDRANGRLVPPSNATAFAEALIELCADEDKRLRFGAAARKHMEEHFSVSRMMADYRRVLRLD